MTALVTPFRGHSVDYAAFDHLVEWQIDQGIEGLVLNSLTAEAPTLTETERRSLISRCVHISKGKIPIVVATGTNSTATTCDRTREAEHLDADAVLIVQPYYNRPAQKASFTTSKKWRSEPRCRSSFRTIQVMRQWT